MVEKIFNLLNEETVNHSRRTALISSILAEQANLPSDIAYECGLWHDAGKIRILDIISKNGKLTDEERASVNMHPVYGVNYIEEFYVGEHKKEVMEAAMYHHKKSDGSGYPQTTAKTDLPLMVQLVGIADCFEALTAKRAYKDGMPFDVAKNKIFNGECGYFTTEVKYTLEVCFDKICSSLK